MKVSIITPSTRRPEQLRACMDRLIETTKDNDVEIICVIDDCPASVAALEGLPIIVIDNPKHKGAAACWNQGSLVATGEAFVLGADDVIYHDGWLDAALVALAKMGGSGMVGLNDTKVPEHAFATHHLMTRDFIIEHMGGCFVIPVYRHQFIDLEATARARRAGRYIWARDAIVEHRHPAHKTAPDDLVYRLGGSFHAQDRITYQARLAAGWPDDFEPILKEG